jgi:methyl-accepting chemotaxis protein
MFSKILQKLSLKTNVIIAVITSCVICSLIAIFGFIYFNNQELYRGIINKSQAIHYRLDAATDYVATQQGLEPVIERMKLKYKSPEAMTKEDKEVVLKQVPIVSAMKIGAKDSEKDGYTFHIFSDAPRNEGNQATEKELVIFKKFEANPELKEHVVNTGDFISVFRPVRLNKEQGCFTCHGDPKNSPWGDGRDILGFKMENWQDGKLHGVFEIRTDINKVILLEKSKQKISPSMILILGIIAGSIVAIFLSIFIVRDPIKNLNNIVTELNKSVENVSSATHEIASSSEELSQASTEQAASLQETSSSIEEINSMVNNNTENAKLSLGLTEQSLNQANQGKDVVAHMVTAISDINTSNNGIMSQVELTFKEIENIVEIINQINTKTKVINEIVFQTKLLSFNASVEAARAGEQGKGFAVVAEEVGNLASMSGTAAIEITALLNESKNTVERIVLESKQKMNSHLQNSLEKVETGNKIAHECERVLDAIVASAANVTKMVNEISNASVEQSKGVSEVTKAIAQLDQVTHQNSANAAESANSAHLLSTQAIVLNGLVQDLVSITNGKK